MKLYEQPRLSDYRTHSRATLRREQFRVNRVKEDLGLNLDEFLNLPTYRVEDILDEQRKILKRERDIRAEEEKRAKEEARKKEISQTYGGFFNEMPFRTDY